MVCCLSMAQGPVQAILRPGLWFPGVNRLHSHRECWELPIDVTPIQFIEMITTAVDKIQGEDEEKRVCMSKPTYQIHKTNPETGFVRILCYTRAEWLDVVEIHLSTGKVISFSSGVLPTWFPLCFVFNSLLFWWPFFDFYLNKERLARMRTLLGFNLTASINDPESPYKPNSTEQPPSETTSLPEPSTNDLSVVHSDSTHEESANRDEQA
ncbi:uncharacterized protein LOC135483406 [Lineus longissimus]|uniref:uncharacterized protein LOC135483406 n=1 Tax=Lineus longissimus TaxID=88925 RepID=UPI002B4C452A